MKTTPRISISVRRGFGCAGRRAMRIRPVRCSGRRGTTHAILLKASSCTRRCLTSSVRPNEALTDQEKAAEETWRDAYERREERLDNLAPDLAVVLGLAVLPPLMLLLPGLVIAWIRRGFARTPEAHR